MKWFIIGWLTISVITFGWSAADTDERICYEVASTAVVPCNPTNHVAVGMAAGLFWPLYWSWEIAEQVRS